MFVGQYSHNIDEKGRLAVPVKFRHELKKAVITQGLDSCLFLHPKKEWDKLAEKIAVSSIGKANSRGFARFMLTSAMDVSVDGQGRIIIPDYLRKAAGLKKKVIIAGLYNRLEIWDESKWEQYKSEIEKNSSEIAEAMGDVGI